MTLRLDKFLSSQTGMTRSQIKKQLSENKIFINRKIICDGGMKIDPEKDKIAINGKEIIYRDKVYILLNKPPGYICATEDKNEKTVLDLLDNEYKRKDIFPAGRLDKDTVGMVLITNDGKLSHQILSPKKHIPKYYIVKLAESFKSEYINIFKKGIALDSGEVCLPAVIRPFKNVENTALIEIYEGKFHQIKRMFKAVENKVAKLQRIQMGGLAIPVELGLGEYIEIMHKDVENLLMKPDFDLVFENILEKFSSYWINI